MGTYFASQDWLAVERYAYGDGQEIEDNYTGEIFPGIIFMFAEIAGQEYARTHGGTWGGAWFDYVFLGLTESEWV